jgi:hypothetical protein
MKILNANSHGIIDYAVVLFLWLSPSIFELSNYVSMLTYGLGCVHLALTAFTNFKYGLVKLIPFRSHGWIELVVSIVLIGSPWILGFSEVSVDRIFYVGFGAAVFVTWLFTDYDLG